MGDALGSEGIQNWVSPRSSRTVGAGGWIGVGCLAVVVVSDRIGPVGERQVVVRRMEGFEVEEVESRLCLFVGRLGLVYQ